MYLLLLFPQIGYINDLFLIWLRLCYGFKLKLNSRKALLRPIKVFLGLPLGFPKELWSLYTSSHNYPPPFSLNLISRHAYQEWMSRAGIFMSTIVNLLSAILLLISTCKKRFCGIIKNLLIKIDLVKECYCEKILLLVINCFLKQNSTNFPVLAHNSFYLKIFE